MVDAFFSNLIGGATNALMNQAGINNAVAFQKDLMKYQAKLNYNYSQKDLKTKWLANRTGLEKAGYNPMLALAGVNSNSNWASQASVTDSGTGSSFGTGVANALQRQNLEQQNQLIGSQVNNNNADSILKEQQAVTETYKQLETANHADELRARAVLADKQASYEDKRQAMEQLYYAKQIEKLGNDIKVNSANLLIKQQEYGLYKRNADLINASNSLDYQLKYEHYNPNTKTGRKNRAMYHTGASMRDMLGGYKVPLPTHLK